MKTWARHPPDTGYHYLRWHNFDPALISHREGHPTLDGQPFRDADRFFAWPPPACA